MTEPKKSTAEKKAEELEQANEKKRERILQNLLVNAGRKDWRDARAAIELEQDEDYANLIMAAHVKRRDLTWDALDGMGIRDLALIAWGEELLPSEFKDE